MNLRAFYARPNMHLVVREGRDFLNNDRGRYDLLFVATNGSINAGRTGHTRKYLDTYEAMASYLDHLAPGPGSMMVFVNQPVLHKAESLRLLFAERGLGDFGKAVFAFGAPDTRGQDSMVVKPGGLTQDEIAAITGRWRRGRTRDRCSTRPRARACRASWTPSWGARAGRSSRTIARSCTR
jgi:hypothetical protein